MIMRLSEKTWDAIAVVLSVTAVWYLAIRILPVLFGG
jgi:hypothetical protein